MMKRLRWSTAGLMAALWVNCVPYPEPKDIPEVEWRPLMTTFEKQARGINKDKWDEIWNEYLAHPAIPVRVAVIDTIADPHAPPIFAVHRQAVGGVIKALHCPDANAPQCRGLLLDPPNLARDGKGGAGHADGYLSFREVYDSLSSVLAQWRPEQEHLIIDFAAGWDPIKTPDALNAALDPNIGPIRQLIQRASCQGAIVIAPAGNVTGSVGPLFPARFEIEPAPGADACAKAGYPRPVPIDEGRAPLVYAVGALDQYDQRMVTARPGGLPHLGAYGLSVTSPRPEGAPLILSGGSMSAAIVSGVASAVWTASPALSADEVMARVYEGGVSVDPAHRDDARSRRFPGYYYSTHTQTDFCLGHLSGPCTYPVHRVFLCGALATVLPPEAGLSCDRTPSSFEPVPAPPIENARVVRGEATPCTTTGCGYSTGPNSDQLPNGVVPQPGISGCPGCAVYLGSQVAHFRLTWNSHYVPSMMSAVVKASNASQTNPTQTMLVWFVSEDVWRGLIPLPADTWGATLTVTYMDWDDLQVKTADLPLAIN
ncbi:MAG TPA: S8/S53 family peptidase [Polyangia bacterium]